jgi:hypothetical protein
MARQGTRSPVSVFRRGFLPRRKMAGFLPATLRAVGWPAIAAS